MKKLVTPLWILVLTVTVIGTNADISSKPTGSFALCFYSADAIVARMEQQYKADKWTAINVDQQGLLKEHAEVAKNDELYSIPELHVQIGTVKCVNHFLCCNGVKQMLPAHTNMSAASVLDVRTKWFYVSGQDAIIKKQGKKYPAIMMNVCPMIWDSKASSLPIVEITGPWSNSHTLDEYRDDVFIAETDQPVKTEQELIDRVGELVNEKRSANTHYATVVFPKVNLDYAHLIGDLHSLRLDGTGNRKYTIGQAYEYIRFRMDEKGHPGKAEHAIEGMALVIERPFILWVERSSLTYPLMVAYITPDAWKNP